MDWQINLCTAISPYKRCIFNTLQGVQRSPSKSVDSVNAWETQGKDNQNLFECRFSSLSTHHFCCSQAQRKEAPNLTRKLATNLDVLIPDILWLATRGFACGALQMNYPKMTDPGPQFWRGSLHNGHSTGLPHRRRALEVITDRQNREGLRQALLSKHESARRAHLLGGTSGLN